MEYNKFKISLLEELRDFYGKDAMVYILRGLRDSVADEEGVCIQFTGDSNMPVIPLGDLYKGYMEGSMDMDDCVGRIIDGREKM